MSDEKIIGLSPGSIAGKSRSVMLLKCYSAAPMRLFEELHVFVAMWGFFKSISILVPGEAYTAHFWWRPDQRSCSLSQSFQK